MSKTFEVRERVNDSIRDRLFGLFKGENSKRVIHTLQNINLEIKRGEQFGLIGRNGSGKSTLLKIIMGTYKPDPGGIVETNGKMIRLALGLGFDPNLSARDNIYINGSIIGLSFKRIGSIFDELVSFAGIGNFIDTPVKFYSSGMKSRLAFSVAVYAEADIFLIDEFFGGVGDIQFKEKSSRVFKERILMGKSILLVSHQLELIAKNCDRAGYLNDDHELITGPVKQIIREYKQTFVNKK